MSSNQRTERAIAPYLTHHVSHHGQLTLIPPENAGRVRKSKGKSNKNRTRTDRNEEDLRFNTGAPRHSKSRGRKVGRDAHSLQGRRGVDDVLIPDYPPPSFQEAILTPGTAQVSELVSTAESTQVELPRTSSRANFHPPSSEDSHGLSTSSRATSPSLPIPSASTIYLHPSSALSSRPPSLEPPSPQSMMVNVSRNSGSSPDPSDVEIVDHEPFQNEWEEDRQLGLDLEERVQREWQRRAQATEATSKAKTNAGQSTFEGRGRSRAGRGVLDSDEENGTPGPTSAFLQTQPKRKRRTLSPLRALSPLSTSRVGKDQIQSPTTPSSLYSTFFRSTTSLGRFPLPSSTKGEPSKGRRFFSLKGKERVIECEPLDSWEVVDDEEPSASVNGSVVNVDKYRAGTPTLSLSVPCSSISRQTPAPSTLNADLIPPSARASIPHQICSTPTTPTQPSMLDRPTPPLPVPFVNRQVRRCAPRFHSSLSVSISSSATSTSSPSPLTPTVSTPSDAVSNSPSPTKRPPPPPPPKDRIRPKPTRVAISPPMTPSSMFPTALLTPTDHHVDPVFRRELEVKLPPTATPVDLSDRFSAQSTSMLQHAVEDSLPPTPAEDPTPELQPKMLFPVPPSEGVGNDLWTTPISSAVVGRVRREMQPRCCIHVDERSQTNAAHSLPTNTGTSELSKRSQSAAVTAAQNVKSAVQLEFHRPSPPPIYTSTVDRLSPTFRAGMNGSNFMQDMEGECSPCDSSAVSPSVEGDEKSTESFKLSTTPRPNLRSQLPPICTTFSTQHYSSRPLPRPPGPRSPHTAALGPQSGYPPQAEQCPEGLLIDFESDLLENAVPPEGITSINRQVEGRTSSLTSSSPEEPPPASSTTEHLAPPAFSQYTDFDVLVSRLEDGHRTGADYDALLLVSELVGPASPVGPSSDPISILSALKGKVELNRRRVTKDGRVKLKMSLLGVVVDRCGICLSQFKEGDGGILVRCQHAFHEKCLVSWLAQNRTCPMCRVPLDGPNA